MDIIVCLSCQGRKSVQVRSVLTCPRDLTDGPRLANQHAKTRHITLPRVNLTPATVLNHFLSAKSNRRGQVDRIRVRDCGKANKHTFQTRRRHHNIDSVSDFTLVGGAFSLLETALFKNCIHRDNCRQPSTLPTSFPYKVCTVDCILVRKLT